MNVLDTALAYRAAGFSMVPIRLDGTKTPAVHSWRDLEREPPSEEQIRDWWSRTPPPGIALVCGGVSGGLECIDFDAGAGTIFPAFRALVEEGWPTLLDRVSIVRTPRQPAGYHVWLRCGDIETPGNLKLAKLSAAEEAEEKRLAKAENRKANLTLIETRGEGGYALVPGCPPGCHETGGLYVHAGGRPLGQLGYLSMDERDFLIACARSFDRSCVTPQVTPPTKPGADMRPGDDFDRTGWDWGELLGKYGWTLAGQSGNERRWRRPGKDRGWSATTGHCRGQDGADLLRVFSSNADPFEEGKAYGKFRAFALLECGGDLSKAAQALRHLGFGSGFVPRSRPAITPKPAPVGAEAEADGTDLAPECWPEPPGRAAFLGLAGDVVMAIDPETEADSVAVLAQFLVAFGSAVGRTGYRPVGTRRHYPNLFAVLVGPSSKGRKGTAWDWIESLFKEADSQWSARCIQAGLSSGEGLIQAVRDSRLGQERDKRTGVTTTVTLDEGAEDKRLLVVEEEFGSTLRVMARDGNTLSAILRQAWDGGRLRTLTRNNPLRATDAHVSVLGHITRQELVRCLTGTDTANGFANRILWLAARRSKLLPDGGMVPSGWPRLVGRLQHALSVARNAGKLDRTAEAAVLWRSHYPRLTAERPGAYGLVTSRAEAQVLRLSVVYSLLDGSDTIGVPHLQAALELWAYTERSCRWVFGTSTGSADADEILDALRVAGPAGLGVRDIRALFSGHRTAQQLRESLAVLVDGGMGVCRDSPTGGRPTQRWFSIDAEEPRGCAQSAQSAQRVG